MVSPTSGYGSSTLQGYYTSDSPSTGSTYPQGVLPPSALLSSQGVTQPAAAPKPQHKGFFGTLFGAAKSLVKGATVGLGKALIHSLTDPKSLLMMAAGAALIIGTGGAATPFVVGAGLAMAGKTVVTNGIVAAKAYASGDDAAGDAALENVGTGLGAGALAVAGAKIDIAGDTEGATASDISTTDAIKGTYGKIKTGVGSAYDEIRTNPDGYFAGAKTLGQNFINTGRGNLSGFVGINRADFASPAEVSTTDAADTPVTTGSTPNGSLISRGTNFVRGLFSRSNTADANLTSTETSNEVNELESEAESLPPGSQQANALLQRANQLADRIGGSKLTQGLVNSKPGTVVSNFNDLFPGGLAGLASTTPFNFPGGDLKDDALYDAAQANPFILQGLQ